MNSQGVPKQAHKSADKSTFLGEQLQNERCQSRVLLHVDAVRRAWDHALPFTAWLQFNNFWSAAVLNGVSLQKLPPTWALSSPQ